MKKTKEFLKRHGGTIAIVGMILGTAVLTYIAAQKGFTSILEGYTMHIARDPEEE